MVKNAAGGNKAKGFARKGFIKSDSALRTSKDPAEVYAQVTKILGGANCQVVSVDGKEFLCHIRGKFRGRGKRDNFIGTGTWLLVGLYDWEKESSGGKLQGCDVIEVYSESDKTKLRNSVTNVNWNTFILNDNKKIGDDGATGDIDEIAFTDEKTQEFLDLIESQVSSAQPKAIITTDDGAIIDVDDI
jgi:initiation factor 1A